MQKTLGHNLRMARKSKRMTLESAGEALRLSKSRLSDIENDKSHPTLPQFAGLCDLYEISMDAAMGRANLLLVPDNLKAAQQAWVKMPPAFQHTGLEILGALLTLSQRTR